GQESVKNADLILQHGHAKTAKDALQNDSTESDETKPSYEGTLIGNPNPDRERNSQASDHRRDQTMGVLKKYSANPARERKQKHVVSECRRPIRNRQADSFARHHAAAANEE